MSSDFERYYGRANPDLAAALPDAASVIVEVGCGAGALGALYKARHPQCRYLGIEANPEAAARARDHMDGILVGDIESLDAEGIGRFVGGPVDCFVYGDVLEHLRDPWQIVRAHAGLLSEDGIMVASIPNAQYWVLIELLLHGAWDYRDSGPLDRGHLRWFTLPGIQRLFEENGLFIHKIALRPGSNANFGRFFAALEPALGNLGIDKECFARLARAPQFIIQAGRRPAAAVG
ncbi:MAG TPA: class I SAM-dependent methyltransferase [Azospirillum sp.]|nr:class I SAM-dependent methyltransferase [Azospirillum sp.]